MSFTLVLPFAEPADLSAVALAKVEALWAKAGKGRLGGVEGLPFVRGLPADLSAVALAKAEARRAKVGGEVG